MVLTDKILTFYDPVPCKWDDVKRDDPGLVLHTVNYLQQINIVKYKSKVVLQGRFKVNDIRHLNGTGLIIGKRGSNVITHYPIPLKLDDTNSGVNIFHTNDNIISIDYNFEGDTPYIYVCDSEEYIKKYELMRKESTNLRLIEEYFTYTGFTGKEVYRINDGMIFVKTLGVRLQNKDVYLKNVSSLNQSYNPPLDMDESTIDEDFPLVSQDVLMFWGKAQTSSLIFKPTKALIIPSYESPLFRLLPSKLAKYLDNEFFYYPKSVNQEFIVYKLNRPDIDWVEFAFYRPNGKYESSIHLKIKGVQDYNSANVSVSPNGKYIFYVEEYAEDEDESEPKHKNTKISYK